MKQLSSADFRKQYASLSEPAEVMTHGKPMGEWFPSGTHACSDRVAEQPPAEATQIPTRMTIRPAQSERPNLVATEKRVIDPIQRSDQERDIWTQLKAKMDQSPGSKRR